MLTKKNDSPSYSEVAATWSNAAWAFGYVCGLARLATAIAAGVGGLYAGAQGAIPLPAVLAIVAIAVFVVIFDAGGQKMIEDSLRYRTWRKGRPRGEPA